MTDSAKIVTSAPMSFSGSAARLHRAMPGGRAWVAWATCLVPLAWIAVLGWYLLFGLFLVPYRLVRRGQRKRKLADARHTELLAASRQA